MFRKTYVSALRTIVRSPLTWGAIALFLGIGIYNQIVVHYGIIDTNTLEMIPDTDPGFVMTFRFYIQEIRNCAWAMSLMLFTVPGISTDLRSQKAKAASPILVILSGIVTDLR